MNNDYDSDDVEQELDDNKQSYTLYENSTYMVVSKVAYLIGVPKAIFENEHEPPKMVSMTSWNGVYGLRRWWTVKMRTPTSSMLR